MLFEDALKAMRKGYAISHPAYRHINGRVYLKLRVTKCYTEIREYGRGNPHESSHMSYELIMSDEWFIDDRTADKE